MKTDRTTITVCLPSEASHMLSGGTQMFHEHFCAVADGTPLPEEIADLFSTKVTRENGRVYVRVEFA